MSHLLPSLPRLFTTGSRLTSRKLIWRIPATNTTFKIGRSMHLGHQPAIESRPPSPDGCRNKLLVKLSASLGQYPVQTMPTPYTLAFNNNKGQSSSTKCHRRLFARHFSISDAKMIISSCDGTFQLSSIWKNKYRAMMPVDRKWSVHSHGC